MSDTSFSPKNSALTNHDADTKKEEEEEEATIEGKKPTKHRSVSQIASIFFSLSLLPFSDYKLPPLLRPICILCKYSENDRKRRREIFFLSSSFFFRGRRLLLPDDLALTLYLSSFAPCQVPKRNFFPLLLLLQGKVTNLASLVENNVACDQKGGIWRMGEIHPGRSPPQPLPFFLPVICPPKKPDSY